MCMDNKIAFGTKKIALRMDTLFARGLNVALIRKVGGFNKDDIVRSESLISPAAGSDDKALIVNTAAYIAPGSCDKTG